MDCFHVRFELVVTLHTAVRDCRRCSQELVLNGAVIRRNQTLLLVSQSQQSLLFLDGQALELLHAICHLSLDHWQERIAGVGHTAHANSIQGRLEARSLNGGRVCRVVDLAEHFVDRTFGNSLKSSPEIGLLVSLDTLEHSNCTIVEVCLSSHLRRRQEVDQRSLLDELVLVVDSLELELLLGEFEVLVLLHLNSVSPLVAQLSILISRVSVVEDGELGSREEREVLDLRVADVVRHQELVMPDHRTKPVVVLPTAKARDGVDRSNV